MTVPLSSLTDTWNSGATVFTAIQMNVTNTASAAGSLLLDLQIGGSSKFNVDINGGITIGGDTSIERDAANSVGQRNGVTAQTFAVYNTFTDASNYERAVIDWTPFANKISIGAQWAGTGTPRNVTIRAANAVDFMDGVICWNTNALSFNGGNDQIAIRQVTGNCLALPTSHSATMAAGDGTFLQWGGQSRVTSDFSVTSTTALLNVTGLSVNLEAGRTYFFETELYITDAAAGGARAAIAGTATATNINYTGYMIADNAIKGKANATALATVVANSVTTETSGIIIRITGTITVNAAGTLTVQMAQSVSNGTATVAKRGSWFYVYDMP